MGTRRLSFTMLPKLGRNYGLEVNCLDDLPKLAEAMETFGKFESARRVMEWYADLIYDIEMEHTIGKTISKSI